MKKIDRSSKVRTGFHQAKWDEPIIFELTQPGERGILVNKADAKVASSVQGTKVLPEFLQRKAAPVLPEISQPRVLRHYARLAQETLGADVNIEIGQGTCTIKYSPKVNDQLANLPQLREMHPLQDESTCQGIMVFGGVIEKCGILDVLLEKIKGLTKTVGSLVLTTVLVEIALNLVTASQYMTGYGFSAMLKADIM